MCDSIHCVYRHRQSPSLLLAPVFETVEIFIPIVCSLWVLRTSRTHPIAHLFFPVFVLLVLRIFVSLKDTEVNVFTIEIKRSEPECVRWGKNNTPVIYNDGHIIVVIIRHVKNIWMRPTSNSVGNFGLQKHHRHPSPPVMCVCVCVARAQPNANTIFIRKCTLFSCVLCSLLLFDVNGSGWQRRARSFSFKIVDILFSFCFGIYSRSYFIFPVIIVVCAFVTTHLFQQHLIRVLFRL